MKQVIKFKGKSKQNGEWLYGDLVRNVEGTFAVVPPFQMNLHNSYECYEVDAETIGQFVGLHDKNGNEIYEGDILEWVKDERKYVVKFMDGMFYASVKEYNQCIYGGFPLHVLTNEEEGFMCKVIGNIHDDKELLKGGNK